MHAQGWAVARKHIPIEKVIVFKAEKIDGKRVQKIKIQYNGIGFVTLP